MERCTYCEHPGHITLRQEQMNIVEQVCGEHFALLVSAGMIGLVGEQVPLYFLPPEDLRRPESQADSCRFCLNPGVFLGMVDQDRGQMDWLCAWHYNVCESLIVLAEEEKRQSYLDAHQR